MTRLRHLISEALDVLAWNAERATARLRGSEGPELRRGEREPGKPRRRVLAITACLIAIGAVAAVVLSGGGEGAKPVTAATPEHQVLAAEQSSPKPKAKPKKKHHVVHHKRKHHRARHRQHRAVVVSRPVSNPAPAPAPAPAPKPAPAPVRAPAPPPKPAPARPHPQPAAGVSFDSSG